MDKKQLDTIHNECRQIWHKGFYEPNGHGKPDIKGRTKACKIYDTLTGGDDGLQDCIGENFNHLIHQVTNNWFGPASLPHELDAYFMDYILKLYLFVERVDLIYEVINQGGKSKIFTDFQKENMKTLREINKWANFFKHPKEFLFSHWPTYYSKGDPDVEISDEDVNIDTTFIFDHYNTQNQQRPNILENNNKVFVEVPDLEKLSINFCSEMNIFFDFICSNKIVADHLKKKSTIANYDFSEEIKPIAKNGQTTTVDILS